MISNILWVVVFLGPSLRQPLPFDIKRSSLKDSDENKIVRVWSQTLIVQVLRILRYFRL